MCIRQNERICIDVCMSVSVCMCGTRIRISKHHHLWLEEYHLVCHWRRIWYWEPERGERNWNHPCVRLYIFLPIHRVSLVCRVACDCVYVHFQAKQKFSNIQHSCQFIQSKQFVCGCHRVYIDIAKIERKKTITTIATKKTDLFIWIVNCYTTSPIRKRDTAKTIPTTKISKCVFFVIFAQFHWILFFNKKKIFVFVFLVMCSWADDIKFYGAK